MLMGLVKKLVDQWHARFVERYDPAKHYMRGPGPKCALKRAEALSSGLAPTSR